MPLLQCLSASASALRSCPKPCDKIIIISSRCILGICSRLRTHTHAHANSQSHVDTPAHAHLPSLGCSEKIWVATSTHMFCSPFPLISTTILGSGPRLGTAPPQNPCPQQLQPSSDPLIKILAALMHAHTKNHATSKWFVLHTIARPLSQPPCPTTEPPSPTPEPPGPIP